MKEKIRINDKVIVKTYYGRPQYKGTVVGFTKTMVEIKKDGLFAGTELETREYIEKLTTL